VRVVSKEAAGGKDLRDGLRKLKTSFTPLGSGLSVSSSGTNIALSVSLSTPAGMRPFGGSAGVPTTSMQPLQGRIFVKTNNNGEPDSGGGCQWFCPPQVHTRYSWELPTALVRWKGSMCIGVRTKGNK
jgi:hypothetical protein